MKRVTGEFRLENLRCDDLAKGAVSLSPHVLHTAEAWSEAQAAPLVAEVEFIGRQLRRILPELREIDAAGPIGRCETAGDASDVNAPSACFSAPFRRRTANLETCARVGGFRQHDLIA